MSLRIGLQPLKKSRKIKKGHRKDDVDRCKRMDMLSYHKNFKREIRKTDVDRLDDDNRKILLDILGIPYDAREYIIRIKEIEYWEDTKE